MATESVKGKDKKSKAATSQATPRKSVRISESAGKRKATEDVSPESVKKRKPVEKAAELEKKKKKAEKKEKKSAAKEDTAAEQNAEQDEIEEEVDDNTRALVKAIDSGDEDEDEAAGGASIFQPGQDVGKAPITQAKKNGEKTTKPKKKAITNGASHDDNDETEGGVVYVGRIPHGFFEHEMRAYFSQFGDIRRLRLSRNRKTGASKHYAFIEFADPEVAEIVAKTMDNYLLFGHILKCSVVPPERVPENLFKGANRRFKKVPWNLMAGRQLGKPLPEAAWTAKIRRENKKRTRRAEKVKEVMGYSYEPAMLSVDAVKDIAPSAEENKVEATEQDKEVEPVQKAITNGKDKTEEAVLAATAAPAASKAKKAKGKKSAKA